MGEREKHGFPGPGPVNLGCALPQAPSARPGQALGQQGRGGDAPVLTLVQGRSGAQNLRTGSSHT